MGLLDNYTGIGMSPRPKWRHQIVMSRAHHLMYDELAKQDMILATEATVTNDWDDLAPDIVAFDSAFVPKLIIEITTHEELKRIIRKCYELIARFPDSEYFAYDYEKEILYLYDSDYDRWLSSEEYDLFSNYLCKPMITYFQSK
ncbi:MAG: hypothetical protein IJT35_03955 [Paludibacteraceae bacterium]|nr:hypothetical protein [Paludibacteraceae bacterium]